MATVTTFFYALGYNAVEAEAFSMRVEHSGYDFITIMVRVDFVNCLPEAFPGLPDGYFYYRVDAQLSRLTYREDFYDFVSPTKTVATAVKLLYEWVVELEKSDCPAIFKLAGYI